MLPRLENGAEFSDNTNITQHTWFPFIEIAGVSSDSQLDILVHSMGMELLEGRVNSSFNMKHAYRYTMPCPHLDFLKNVIKGHSYISKLKSVHYPLV